VTHKAFQNILLAVDGSEQSMKAAHAAADLAGSLGSSLIVLTAFEPVSKILGDAERQRAIAAHMSEAEEYIQAAVEVIGELPGEIVTEVIEGPPAEAILRVQETRGSDLIVMGARGRGRLAGLVLGSVSQKVLAHAPCPVMFVK
jgi:nucleotide-binding universal stress UspA family protein